MSSSNQFELVFEGPSDESAETLRKLRTSLLADAGLSVTEAQEVLSNSPKTVKTAQIEEDLKPLYAALKRAGGKVLIVRPVESSNEKAYFLDLEDSKLDDDLLKSLESLPGEEERAYEVDDVAVDLSKELENLTSAEEALPSQIEIPSELSPEPSEVVMQDVIPEVSNDLEFASETTKILEETSVITPEAPVEIPTLSAEVATEEEPEEIVPATPIPTTPDPIGDKPLFEFSAASEEPVADPSPPPVPSIDLKESKPLFEFGAEQETSPPIPETKEESKEAAPTAKPQSSILDDLTLALDDAPAIEVKPKTEVPVNESSAQPSVPKKEEEAPFSSDELSFSLSSQLESEKDAVTTEPAPPVKQTALSVEAEVSATPKAAPESQATQAQRPATTNPNIIIEPEGGAAQPDAATEEVPEPVPFKSGALRGGPSLDLLLPILVGAIILGVANWLYFKPPGEILLPQISFSNEPEVNENEEIRRREIVPTTERKLQGKSQLGALSISWTVIFDKEELKSISIEGTTPAPPEMTPEQIVRSERPPAWLYKVEVSQFQFEKQLGGTWQAKGPARVFVNQGVNKRRLVAQAEINIESFKAPESVVGNFSIVRGFSGTPNLEEFKFEQLINGDIQLLVAASLK